MIPPNRLQVSPKVMAIRFRSEFSVSFPYDEAAVRLARQGPQAYWDQTAKSWCMSGYDIARVMEVMEQIHGALCAAGKDKEEDRDPKAWIDWKFVSSNVLPIDTEGLEEGQVMKLPRGHVVIEKVGEPYVLDGRKRPGLFQYDGQLVCEAWHRVATGQEVTRFYEQDAENDGPEM